MVHQPAYDLPGSSAVKGLYRNRWLLYELVMRDLRLRYRGSVLGFGWTLINPLLLMMVYTLVFGIYLKIGIRNFPLYLLSGIMPWTWFANAIQAGTSSILDGRTYVGKAIFPAGVLVVVPVVSNLINFLFSLPFLIVIAMLFHQRLGLPLLLFPVLVLIQAALMSGILFFLATYNVFYRDLQQLVVYFVMLLFYLIPIFYPASAVPPAFRPIVTADPFAMMISGYQHIFYFNTFPNLTNLLTLAIFAAALAIAGYAAFESHKETLGEYL